LTLVSYKLPFFYKKGNSTFVTNDISLYFLATLHSLVRYQYNSFYTGVIWDDLELEYYKYSILYKILYLKKNNGHNERVSQVVR